MDEQIRREAEDQPEFAIHIGARLVSATPERVEFEMPVTQEQLGDTMGLTAVHVNRVLQRMRAEGLITFKGRKLAIHDMEEMRRIADFDPMYLHLTRRRA